MELYSGQILSGIVVVLVGAAVIAIVKATLKSSILEMQNYFVSITVCKLKHENTVEDRESIRKDIQNHEERLNGIGA